MSLYSDLWDNSYTNPAYVERLGPVAVWAQWQNPGGVQRFGATVLRPGAAAYRSFERWKGKRLIVHDGFCDRPVLDGTIMMASLGHGTIEVTAAGPWWRLFDDYEATNPGAGDFTSTVITRAITAHNSVVSTDVSGIVATAVSANGFTFPTGGMPVGRTIEEMMLGGDGGGNPLVFWIEPAPFTAGGAPQKPLAKMEALSTSASIDWQIWARDKAAGSVLMAADLGDLATSVTAVYDNAGVPAVTAAATHNTSTYWTRSRMVSARGGTATMAAAVRDAELAKLSDPQQRMELVLGGREIADGMGEKWPLWRMLISGGYLRDNEIGPDEGLFDLSLDYTRVGRITSMRYDHAARQMQVSLNADLRLDSVLARFGYEWRLVDQLKRELEPGV